MRTEGYCQPLIGGYLLKVNRLVLSDGTTYCVDLVHSKFAHHLIAITRGEAVTKKYNCFSNFQATTWKGLSEISIKNFGECIDIPFKVICGVYKYLRTLNKPDTQSAIAKMSQLLPDHTGYHLNFIRAFSELVIKTDSRNYVFKGSLIDELKAFIGRMFPARLAGMFDVVRAKCLDDFVWMMQEYTFKVELKTLSANAVVSAIFDETNDIAIGPQSVLNLLDNFSLPQDPLSHSVYENKYSIGPYACEVEISSKLLARLVFEYTRPFFAGFCKRREVGTCVEMYYMAKTKISLMHFHKILNLDTDPVIAALFELLGAHWYEFKRPHKCGFFANLGWRWLLQGAQRRLNQVYIASYPEVPGRDLCQTSALNWAKVCGEIEQAKGLPFLPLVSTSSEVHNVSRDSFGNEGAGTSLEVEDFEVDPALLEPPLQYQILRCVCSTEILGQEVRGLELIPMHFPDVLKGRRAAWYTKDRLVNYVYNGGEHESLGWKEELDIFLGINGLFREGYDSVLIQEYAEGSNLGLHADDEEIFKEGSPICTVQVQGSCVFKFNCNKHTTDVPITGPVLFTMPAGFQETHRHGLANARDRRVSCTFRILKVENDDPVIPSSRKTADKIEEASGRTGFVGEEIASTLFGVKTVDRVVEAHGLFLHEDTLGDGNCFYRACASFLGISHCMLRKRVAKAVDDLKLKDFPEEELVDGAFVTNASIAVFSLCFAVSVEVYYSQYTHVFITRPAEDLPAIPIYYEQGHYTYLRPRNDCVIQALTDAFQRPRCDIVGALHRQGLSELLRKLKCLNGIPIEVFTEMVKKLGVHAYLHYESGEVLEVNVKGNLKFHFNISHDHIEFRVHGKSREPIRSEKVQRSDEICTGELELTLVSSKIQVELLRESAQKLVEAFNEGLTGVLCSQLFNGMEEFKLCMPEGAASVSCELHFMLGVFGCGKSTLYSRALEMGLSKVGIFVTPRKLLADELRETFDRLDLDEKPKVYTYEIFLKRAATGLTKEVVVFDECQLYPHGFFDLVVPMIKENGVRKIFLVGDPCQSDYDSEKDRIKLSQPQLDIERFLEGKQYNYYTKSHRFLNPDFEHRLPCDFVGLETEALEPLLCYQSLEEAPVTLSVECLLVASFSEKRAMSAYFQGVGRVMTFGESTGLTFDSVAILVTESAVKTTERRWITALTRSRKCCAIISNLGVSFNRLSDIFQGRVLGRFLCRTASVSDLLELLPGEPRFTGELKNCELGRNHGVKEEKLRGDPWLKTMIFLGQEEDVALEEFQELEVAEESFKTHLPRTELESLRAKWVGRFKAKELRECRIGNVVSDQFAEDHHRNHGKILSNAAERFEAIYPRHKAGDTATFIMAARKRLRFSNPMKEMGKFKKSQAYGPFLLEEFLRRVPLKPGHNRAMMEKACRDFEDKKTSKSAAIIENHAGRSNQDWSIDQGLVFMKSQLCTKFENRFRDAKAAQSIVCFSHAVLCRFAPYIRYIEQKVMEALPEKFYIHSGKGLEELNEWVLRGNFQGVCTESDYEAFDASQDQYIMAFEIALMEYLGIPRDLVKDYIFIKTHLGSKLGNFAIMRFSGEASTFLFNTLANMLFTFLKYDLSGKERICFAGDDMCANQRLRVSAEHEGFLNLLKLKAKVGFTEKPTFCGWNLTRYGIFKKPQLILERCCIAKERNVLADCIDNYAIELGYAYKLKELAVCEMDEEEAEAFFNCVKIVIKNKHLLKSDVRKLYEAS